MLTEVSLKAWSDYYNGRESAGISEAEQLINILAMVSGITPDMLTPKTTFPDIKHISVGDAGITVNGEYFNEEFDYGEKSTGIRARSLPSGRDEYTGFFLTLWWGHLGSVIIRCPDIEIFVHGFYTDVVEFTGDMGIASLADARTVLPNIRRISLGTQVCDDITATWEQPNLGRVDKALSVLDK